MVNIKPKRTFFNSRNNRYYQNYNDNNNYLFTIFFDGGAEMSFILRDLKKNDNIKIYIYNKLHTIFNNIFEIEISNISYVEYNLMKTINVPSIIKIC